MRKLMSHLPKPLVVLALTAGALSAASAPAAHADVYGLCWQAGCNGLDPIAERCDQGVTTVSSFTYTFSDGTRYEVDLRYSAECETNWARVVTSTAQPFCITNSKGNVDRYTSAPNTASWTNMINGAPGVHDTAYLKLPRPTEVLGEPTLYAADQVINGYNAYSTWNYPC
jgi:hypothetical protein